MGSLWLCITVVIRLCDWAYPLSGCVIVILCKSVEVSVTMWLCPCVSRVGVWLCLCNIVTICAAPSVPVTLVLWPLQNLWSWDRFWPWGRSDLSLSRWYWDWAGWPVLSDLPPLCGRVGGWSLKNVLVVRKSFLVTLLQERCCWMSESWAQGASSFILFSLKLFFFFDVCFSLLLLKFLITELPPPTTLPYHPFPTTPLK